MTRNTIIGNPDRPDDPTASSNRLPDTLPTGDSVEATHRANGYATLALGLERPDDRYMAAVEGGIFGDQLVQSISTVDDDLSDLAMRVSGTISDVDRLEQKWSRLFGVEHGLTVSPYELTYLPGPLVTNVRVLADINGFYRAFGLTVASGRNDRCDHICFMLEFLSHLSLSEAHLRTVGDCAGVAIVVDARRSFVEDHLGRWFWRFTDEVTARDEGFHAAVAELVAGVMEHEIDSLSIEPEWVPDHPAVTDWTEGIFGDAGRDCGGCGANPG